MIPLIRKNGWVTSLAVAVGAIVAAWALPAAAFDQPVEGQIEVALLDEVVAQTGWDRERVVLSALSLPAGMVISDDTRVLVEVPQRERMLGRIPFQVAVAGSAGRPGWGSAKVDVMVDTVVATRHIGRHQIITPDLVTVNTVPMTRALEGGANDPMDLVGQRAVLRIPQGRVVTASMVEAQPVVHRGDHITLIVRRPGLVVTTMGEARQDGAPDHTIQVLNIKSRRTVQGRVLDANTVEVMY